MRIEIRRYHVILFYHTVHAEVNANAAPSFSGVFVFLRFSVVSDADSPLTKPGARAKFTIIAATKLRPFYTAFREPADGASREQEKGAVSLPSRVSENGSKKPRRAPLPWRRIGVSDQETAFAQ